MATKEGEYTNHIRTKHNQYIATNRPKVNCVISIITVYCTAKGGSYWLTPTVTNLKGVVLGTGGCKGMLLLVKVLSYSINNNIKYIV
ncbi:hypothetical protein V8B55DRAFT_1514561, partial [Mucor lusitanicus]